MVDEFSFSPKEHIWSSEERTAWLLCVGRLDKELPSWNNVLAVHRRFVVLSLLHLAEIVLTLPQKLVPKLNGF